MRVTEQSLAQRQGINREGEAVNECMPAVGFSVFNSREVSLHDALITQRSKFLQLCLADAAAWGGKIPEDGFTGEFLVERDEFAKFVTAGVSVGGFNGGQFEWQQNAELVLAKKFAEGRNVMDGRQLEL